MLRHLKYGFKMTSSQHFLLLVLWLYQFAWGLLLMAFVQSIVVPLMHRYPSGHLSQSAVQLFLAEGEFQLTKTDISYSYLWTLLGLVVARMVLTPLLNAGVFYSIHNSHLNSGYRFFRGIRELGGSFTLYYLCQMALTAAPLYWIVPIAKKALVTVGSYEGLASALLPYVAGVAVYGYLIHLLFVYIMLGRTAETSTFESVRIFFSRFLVILLLASLLLLLSGLLTAITMSVSLLWAGLSAYILHQLFHVLKMLFKLWAVSSQYHHFNEQQAR
ncbi:hypothetical protein [Paenibacillus koleovorans]|uniref:hypothetical protein n=1 Tax=Paenibacillus koleovorans TaxID=121608 RepID=UPI000FD9261C|nr:hypothetical protein [Paenibacillus koleovorans]